MWGAGFLAGLGLSIFQNLSLSLYIHKLHMHALYMHKLQKEQKEKGLGGAGRSTFVTQLHCVTVTKWGHVTDCSFPTS